MISRIEVSMENVFPPTEHTSSADVVFLHFPSDQIEDKLFSLNRSGKVSVNSTIVLCSSRPYGMGNLLKRNSLQKFADRHVLGDPAMFQRVIGDFMAGLAAGKVRIDLLAARAPPEALVGLYLLLMGHMDQVSIESYRAVNYEKLRSEARVYLREGVTIDSIDSNALSDALARAFER